MRGGKKIDKQSSDENLEALKNMASILPNLPMRENLTLLLVEMKKLSLTLLLVCLLLVNDFSAGQWLLGALLGVLIPISPHLRKTVARIEV